MIRDGRVVVNGQVVKPGYLLKSGDKVEVSDFIEKTVELEAENIDLDLVFENDDFLIINKPAGMVVHPSENGDNISGTVANAIKNVVEKGVGDDLRPGIVHRIDKDTSGLLLLAKTRSAFDYLRGLFKDRKIRKTYLALVLGRLEHKEGIIDSPLGRGLRDRKKMRVSTEKEGRSAVTEYRVLEEFDIDGYSVSLLDVEIKTGRTHQIRVHMSVLGHPVIGDEKYGNSKANRYFADNFDLKRQFLHAHELEFVYLNNKKISAKAEIPFDLQNVLDSLKT